VTFDPTLKPKLIDALRSDLPFLKSLSAETNLDLTHFVNDSYLRQAYGPTYDQDLAKYDNPLVVRGRDDVCGGEVTDQRTASEAWFEGEDAVRPARNPTCMLTAVHRAEGAGKKLRAGYVPDAGTGTRTFAAAATWVDDPSLAAAGRLLPFATLDSANAYTAAHPGSKTEDYRSALAAAPA
jgi:NitT/TauT family transport system substrate-binding protein